MLAYKLCENITVTGCVIVSRSSALKIDEVWDDCRNIVFDSCVIYASNRGICIQSRDRGNIHDIIFSNIVINTQLHSAWWWGKAEPICITHMPRDAETKLGKVSNITFSNIICNSENSIYIHGWKDNPVEDIVLDNVKVTIDKKTDWPGGWYDDDPINPSGNFIALNQMDAALGEIEEILSDAERSIVVSCKCQYDTRNGRTYRKDFLTKNLSS